MADNSLKGLYLRIGLNFDELNQDFVQAERSLKDNMTRLSKENSLIDLKLKVNLASLDSAKDSIQGLKIQEQALTEQIENQRVKVQLANAAWREATLRTGQHSKQALNTAFAVQKQQLALVELEQELKKVNEQQNALPKADNKLVSGYKGLKSGAQNLYTDSIGALASKYNELSAAAQTTDGAISKSLEIIGNIPHPVGRAVAALLLLPLALKGVENTIIGITKAAASAGDSVYVMSRGFQMSIADTAKFTTNCKVAGVQVDDLASTVKRLQQQVLKAGSAGNAVTRMLERYGVSAFDAGGHLKNLNDMTAALSKGLKKAQAEGNGAAFAFTVFRNASGDALTAIEDWADVSAQASTIVKNGLANPKLAHEVQGNLNAMGVQAAQMNASFASAFLPVANEIIPRVTARMGDLTRFLADNKDEIKEFGQAFGEFFGKIEDGADLAFSAIGKVVRGLKELKVDKKQKELEKSLSFNFNPNMTMYNQTLAYYNPMFKGLEKTRSEVKDKVDKIADEIKKPFSLGGISASVERSVNDDVLDAKLEEARKTLKIERETASILYRIDHDSYDSRKNDLFEWWREVSTAQNLTNDQRVAYEKQYHAKLKELEKEHSEEVEKQQEETQNRIKEIMQQAEDTEFALTHTAFEKQLHDIERWKEAQFEKGDTAEEVAAIIRGAAAKEAEAYEREVERIKSATQSLEDEIFAMENSQYEVDKRRAMQRAQQALDEGVDSETVQRYLQDKFAELDKKAAKGGDYVEAPNGGGSGPKYIDFDKPEKPSIGLFADSDKIMARLKSSTAQQVKDVQSLMAQTAESDIEIIRGLRSNLKSAGNFAPQVISQTQLPMEQFQNAIATTLARQMQTQPAPITVSPTINISLEGNVVADQQWIDDTAEKIKDEVCNGITSAVESATKNNYSYAN